MTKKKQKLKLSKETVRTLSERDLTLVAGGQLWPMFIADTAPCNGSPNNGA